MDRQNVNVETLGIHDLVNLWAKEKPNQAMFTFEGNQFFPDRIETYTYRQMDALTNKLANAFISFGLKKGDVVAIYLPNCPEWIITYLAAFKAGAIVTPVSPIYTRREATYQLSDSNAALIVTASLLTANIDREALPGLKHVLLIDGQTPEDNLKTIIDNASADPPGVSVNITEDIVMLPYTSGTTGVPKGVPHTHFDYQWNIREAIKHVHSWDADTVMVVTPLFHVTGYHDVLGMAMFLGIQVIVLERFDPVKVVELIQKYNVSFTLIPTAGLIHMLNAPGREKYDLSSLSAVMSGGTAVPQDVGRSFVEAFNVDLIEGYGSNEILISHVNPRAVDGPVKFGSVGLPMNNNKTDIITKIVDETNPEIERGPGEVGEILIKLPCNATSYWNKPEDSAEGFKDGFWFSGDVGFIDEDGYLFITDRKKDMINVSGFKCWPREVEELIISHPKVSDATVVGRSHNIKGEEPVAFVAPAPGCDINDGELLEFLKDKLAKYKLPVEFRFMENLPKTAVGKADKISMKAML